MLPSTLFLIAGIPLFIGRLYRAGLLLPSITVLCFGECFLSTRRRLVHLRRRIHLEGAPCLPPL